MKLTILMLSILMFLSFFACSDLDKDRSSIADPDFEIVCANNDEVLCQWPDKDLYNNFINYWHLRFSGPIQDVFLKEAPYFQYVVPIGRYASYVQGFFNYEIEKLEVFSINKTSDNLIEIPLRLWFKDISGNLKETSMMDRWIIVEGKWYHVIRNPLFFPEFS